MNKNTTVLNLGRPRLPVKFPKGVFTVAEVFALNKPLRSKLCVLTIRNHITREVNGGKLIKLAEKATTGTVGAPALKYQLKSVYEYNLNRRVTKPVVNAAPKSTAEVAAKLASILS